MSFAGLLRARLGTGPGQYKTYGAMAKALDCGNAIYNWSSGRTEPRGGNREMLRLAEILGYTREEAIAKIAEDDLEPAGRTTEQVLREDLHMPDDVVVRFLPGGDLAQGDPATWSEVWGAALPVMSALLRRRDD
ncbi:hypothetical protein [Frankia sp. AgB32]|uniref:hypothetical protein n=1 Tax=Frankia sp. AgB32 TaxID=631119 RepID=UPI00200F42C2|nr:hypothetical protein [Frankia sp. AgB32]MCK9894732.1 hypothetical protein [Frankia sp. AgB32]